MQLWTDLLRTTVIGHGISILIFIVIVLLRYAKVLMKNPGFYRRDRRIPWHILTTATSYLLLTGFTCTSLVMRIGEPFSWRIPVAIVAFLLGNVGMFLMASYLKDELDKQYRF